MSSGSVTLPSLTCPFSSAFVPACGPFWKQYKAWWIMCQVCARLFITGLRIQIQLMDDRNDGYDMEARFKNGNGVLFL